MHALRNERKRYLCLFQKRPKRFWSNVLLSEGFKQSSGFSLKKDKMRAGRSLLFPEVLNFPAMKIFISCSSTLIRSNSISAKVYILWADIRNNNVTILNVSCLKETFSSGYLSANLEQQSVVPMYSYFWAEKVSCCRVPFEIF